MTRNKTVAFTKLVIFKETGSGISLLSNRYQETKVETIVKQLVKASLLLFIFFDHYTHETV